MKLIPAEEGKTCTLPVDGGVCGAPAVVTDLDIASGQGDDDGLRCHEHRPVPPARPDHGASFMVSCQRSDALLEALHTEGVQTDWVIAGPIDPDDGQHYWSNTDGWVDRANTTVFDDQEANLPDGGRWEALLERTVVLGPFPEYVELTYNTLRIGPDGDPIAFLSEDNGRWYLQDEAHPQPFSDLVVWQQRTSLWVLSIDHRHGLVVSLHRSEEDARAELRAWAELWWEDEIRDELKPEELGDVDVERYFQLVESEGYVLELVAVSDKDSPAATRGD
jgi:hypothetical protein